MSDAPDALAFPRQSNIVALRLHFQWHHLLGIGFMVLLLLAGLSPRLFTHVDPLTIAPRQAFLPPSWEHVFGTDPSGRDIYARIVYGVRQSLLLGLGATLLSLGVALALAMVGGLGGRIAYRAVSWVVEVLFAFPVLVLALLITATIGSGVSALVVAIGIGSAPGYARVLLGQIVAVRGTAYVEAAKALGHTPLRITLRHILPNALAPLFVLLTLGVGQAIVWSSGLSFLGLGAAPPAAEWGTMLSMGRDFVAVAPWLTFFPGLAIVLTMLTTTSVGRSLERYLETRAS